MKKYNINKILIPVDFSETSLLALEHGVHLASLFKADITLLHVIHLNLSAYTMMDMALPVDLIKSQEQNASQKLKQLAKEIRVSNNVDVSTLYETGFVCSTIISVAERSHTDLIIMGTHGVSGFTERFIGSNAYRVVNDSTCPVITIQAHATRKGFKDIALPVDNSAHSLQKVSHAIEFANRFGSNIHILGLTHTEDETEHNKLIEKIRQIEACIENNALATGIQIRSSRQIMRGMNYAKVTMSYAEEIGADLIMIMTEWEESITGFFIGPFARQIVNHSKIPVMSIRPETESELVEDRIPWTEHHLRFYYE